MNITIISAITRANLDGLGAVGTGAHSERETLDIKALPIQTHRVALFIYRLANTH